jgi:NodT family efflux transporter outer membrane factor (OMF) lipoprotein
MIFIVRLLRFSAFATLLVVSTAAGPGRKHSAPAAPEQFVGASEVTAVSSVRWWTEIRDKTLSRLIEQALDRNLDLRTIDSQLSMSRAMTHQAIAPVLPMVGIEIGQQLQPCTVTGFSMCNVVAAQAGVDPPDSFTQGSAALAASLGLDVWGEQIQTWRSARLEYAALEGDQQALALIVASQVGQAWLDIRHTESIIELISEQRDSTQALLDDTVTRFARSEATALDVLQQRQQLAALDAQLPIIRSQQERSMRQLAVLLGGDESTMPEPQAGLPELSNKPGLGSPQDLIQRRPDVAAAWSRYEAARRRESAAWRATLPDLAVSAQTGLTTIDIVEAESERTWAVGASISIPLMTGGAATAGLLAARAESDALHLAAQQVLLEAVAEVETGLALVQGVQGQREALNAQTQAAELAHTEAVKLYSAGLTPYLSVLSTMSALQQAQLSRLQAHRDHLSARISLSTALGATPGALE